MKPIKYIGKLEEHENIIMIDTGDCEYTYKCEDCKKTIGWQDRHVRCIEIKECKK